MPNDTSSCCKARARVVGKTLFGAPMKTCACCGSELHFIGRHPKEANVFVDLDGIFVNDNKYGTRLRQATYRSKYFVGKHGHIVRTEVVESYTYNWTSGRLYRVHIVRPGHKTVRDITYVINTFALKRQFVTKAIQLRAIHLFPEFDIIRDMEQALGVDDIFKLVDDIFKNQSPRTAEDHLRFIFYCLAYPRFAWFKSPMYSAPDPKFRKALKTANKKKDLYDAYFNNNVGKSTIAFLEDDEIGKSTSCWWTIKFLTAFLNKDKIWDLINSGWIINMIDNDNYYDSYMDRNLTRAIISKFAGAYGPQRLLNHINDLADQQRVKNHYGNVRMMLRDSIDMWKSIVDSMPEYRLPRQNSLKETHDVLTRDVRKLAVENEDIKYTKSELELNYTPVGDNDIWFILPKDVHTIIDHGDSLHICVGGAGYTNAAVQKKTIILFGFVGPNPVVCMEIKKGQLVQAKMFQNRPARSVPELVDAIKRLCDYNNIDYSHCNDMTEPPMHRSERFVAPGPAAQGNNYIEAENNDWLF